MRIPRHLHAMPSRDASEAHSSRLSGVSETPRTELLDTSLQATENKNDAQSEKSESEAGVPVIHAMPSKHEIANSRGQGSPIQAVTKEDRQGFFSVNSSLQPFLIKTPFITIKLGRSNHFGKCPSLSCATNTRTHHAYGMCFSVFPWKLIDELFVLFDLPSYRSDLHQGVSYPTWFASMLHSERDRQTPQAICSVLKFRLPCESGPCTLLCKRFVVVSSRHQDSSCTCQFESASLQID